MIVLHITILGDRTQKFKYAKSIIECKWMSLKLLQDGKSEKRYVNQNSTNS